MQIKNYFSMFLGTIAEPVTPNYRYAKIFVSTESYYTPTTEPGAETELKQEFKLGDGTIESFERKDSATITAQWVPIGNPNRTSSPSMVGGETVLVIKIAGIDKYFYTTFFGDLDLKAQDTIEYFFPSRPRLEAKEGEDNKEGINLFKPDPDKEGNELTASYKFIIDTDEEVQQIYLSTSKYNGERAELTGTFDCKNGRIYFFNDMGDLFGLETALPSGDENENEEEVPGILRFSTGGHILHKSGKGIYQDILDGAYSKITGKEFKQITETAMYKIGGSEVKSIEGPAVYEYGDKVTTFSKGDFGIKTLTGNVALDSGGDIGLTTLTGKMKVFSGTEITVISPKVNFVSPAVSVTGTLTGTAISMGAAPSADNAPIQVKKENIQWEKFDELIKKAEDINKLVQPEEEEKEEEKKEEEKEEEKQPDNIDGKDSNQDAILNMKGKFEVKAQMTASIDGTAGTSLKGGGQDLVQILQNFVTEVQAGLMADLSASQVLGAGNGAVTPAGTVTTAVTANIVPTLTQTTAACTKAMTALTMFKGAASYVLVSDKDNELKELNLKSKIVIPEGNLEYRLFSIKKKLNLKKK